MVTNPYMMWKVVMRNKINSKSQIRSIREWKTKKKVILEEDKSLGKCMHV